MAHAHGSVALISTPSTPFAPHESKTCVASLQSGPCGGWHIRSWEPPGLTASSGLVSRQDQPLPQQIDEESTHVFQGNVLHERSTSPVRVVTTGYSIHWPAASTDRRIVHVAPFKRAHSPAAAELEKELTKASLGYTWQPL
jgi:hypothetical protein